ncbi:ATPase, Ca++ transporting, plasma membrane 1 isoform 1 [Reticulomyxa filosa]|uniref:ATPase, Ca++ transporting, plasma membrane 1 isoform 1 n=1 Tax=Reticulomyxa filosa TaxID=46433 RepID=X6NS27_RETFI|nr:ATPase, Ca++ transporting, plasma membrane 1 isoform 1 [Reticulomyxa filosa]|eukprot:ETO28519.1 ATPase, Ca++ transporting, plasma membrane 1 isoform 1 [Reticulomyxa filosa]
MFKAEDWNIVDNRNYRTNSDGQNEELLTLLFNLFVWLQIFNEINARKVQNEWNVFSGIFQNAYFVTVIVVTIVVQVLIVNFGGEFTRTVPLGWKAWLWSIGASAGILIWRYDFFCSFCFFFFLHILFVCICSGADQLLRFFPVNLNHGILELDKAALFDAEDKRNTNFSHFSFSHKYAFLKLLQLNQFRLQSLFVCNFEVFKYLTFAIQDSYYFNQKLNFKHVTNIINV